MTQQVKIDRGAGISLWRQIAEWLKAEIASGTYAKDARVPTEAEIAARFDVNRHTVRRAIAALTNDGILRADQGRGTYVASTPLAYPISRRTRFSEIVSAQDKTPTGKMTAAAEEEADALIATQLGVNIGTPLWRIGTLRVVDGFPVLVSTSWLEKARFGNLPEIYDASNSFTECMKQAGVTDYTRKSTKVTAELIEPSDAIQLGLGEGQPVLVVESVNVGPDGQPVQYTRSRMAADRIQLVIENDG
ncbi:phosphonate metabolism transcriptional regulator PhnF [Roseibium limicola]|uniref:Phosphonate metabolism transcriptional regulator PhnF n=1 Tax=Roseibium limicola TaxID=2816037 RepID=A0A939ERI0_9HYPH|nr:phosphonate metabolism transcriptional regulator PhnF [Roseibium limicola]MBO0346772.1 phosphonate metabolism transcriptional regulator PhnF [Roseibium limicola]